MATRVRTAPGYDDLVSRLGLDDPRRAPAFDRGEVVSASATSTVRRFLDDATGRRFYLKVYRYPLRRPRRLFTFTYRRSRTRTEWESLLHLRAHDVPVVEPVAYGSHRVARVMRSCFLLTRESEGAVDGDTWLEEFHGRVRDDAWRERRRQVLADSADLVRRMHGADFFDYDLKFRNVLVDDDGRTVSFELLDFPKGQIIPASRAAAQRRARVWDLATLDKHAPRWFSRTERLRWFRRYAGRELDDDDRALLREVEAERVRLLAKRR